jgi:hypothetical protein
MTNIEFTSEGKSVMFAYYAYSNAYGFLIAKSLSDAGRLGCRPTTVLTSINKRGLHSQINFLSACSVSEHCSWVNVAKLTPDTGAVKH